MKRADRNQFTGEGRLQHERNDCVVIALSYAFEISYTDAHLFCKVKGREDGKGFFTRKIFSENQFLPNGFAMSIVYNDVTKRVVYYSNPKMTVNTFTKKNKTGTFIVAERGHAFCVKNGIAYNQTNGRKRIRYYFQVL